jgi:LmbE family N-acetylglucosaminyl deacetylase
MKSSGLFDQLGPGGTVLCLGAHSDDIEIGCGGAIRRLIGECEGVTVYWIVFSANGLREREARSSAEDFLGFVQDSRVEIKDFRNGFFPYIATEIKEYFETLKSLRKPDLIFTHCGHDRHQDHRVISELTWNTFRDHLILEYEIPKYDADLRSPNIFVTLSADQVKAKQDHLVKHFKSQHDKQWFTGETFGSLCRLRGIECNSPTGYAEAFYCRKLLV